MRNVRRTIWLITIAAGCTGGAIAAEPEFTTDFPTAACAFSSVGGNSYFPLRPGRQTYFNNAACVATGDCDELVELWITTEKDTRRITLPLDRGSRIVRTRVVEERETHDGELEEISRNFFADCAQAHDVYYFGEEVDIYADGEIVSHDGAWQAGRRGARPGIIMPDSAFIIGSRYYNEIAPDIALDRAEHVRGGFSVTVPAGRFDHCVEVKETTPLEPGSSSAKVYCRNVGLVRDGEVELAAIYYRGHGDDD